MTDRPHTDWTILPNGQAVGRICWCEIGKEHEQEGIL